jgi:hypothetical protein
MLVHEIVKGLYEIVGTEGFGSDKEKNQAIVGAVDKLSNEPRDLQYGKFIYDAISKLYNESNIDDPRVRELFFAEVYKLTDDEFFPFIENVIADKLQPLQKKWAADTMKDIANDLGKDDTGLEDLDEINMKKVIGTAALAAGLAGMPSVAKAQNTFKDKIKAGITAVQNKLNKKEDEPKTVMVPGKRTQDRDLEKIRKEWSGYNSDSTTSKAFGEAVGQTESAARMAARANARAQILKKMKTDQASFGSFIVDEAMWQLPNGNYQAMVLMDKN